MDKGADLKATRVNPENNILIKTFFIQISDLFLLAKTLQVFKSCFE